MQLEKSPLCAGLASLLVLGCGARYVDPPRAPAKEIPKIDARAAPPEPGHTRVLLDANCERARVTEVSAWRTARGTVSTGRSTGIIDGYSESVRPVCIAPCFADFEPGMHVLRFSSQTDGRGSTVAVQVDERSKVVRHAMGRHDDGEPSVHFGGTVLLTLGATSLLIGGLVLAAVPGLESDQSDDYADTGAALLGVGAAAMFVAIPMILVSRPSYQPGSTTEIPQ
jgi:hypothetical protein